jgi:hypothetical protein
MASQSWRSVVRKVIIPELTIGNLTREEFPESADGKNVEMAKRERRCVPLVQARFPNIEFTTAD